MKQHCDLHRTERVFNVGDWVYLRLQPYKQLLVDYRASYKLSSRFFRPFQILERIGEVAYKLDLPAGFAIHPVFHVSYLKAKLGQHNVSIPLLSSVNSPSILTPKPVAILQTRSHKLRNRTITQHLIQWQGRSADDVTGEDLFFLQQQFSHLVGKMVQRGEVMLGYQLYQSTICCIVYQSCIICQSVSEVTMCCIACQQSQHSYIVSCYSGGGSQLVSQLGWELVDSECLARIVWYINCYIDQ